MSPIARALLAAVAILAAGVWERAAAADYPTKAIQIIVPFSSGNVVDLLARSLGEALGRAIGGPTLVVNREGAAGIIAMTAVATARPDGYILGFAPQGQITIQPHIKADLPYRPDSFTPICQTFENEFALVVGPNSPATDFKAFVALAKTSPGKLAWGDSGVATVPNLQMYSLLQSAGIQMAYTPYRTYGDLLRDVASGRLDAAAPSIGSFSVDTVRVLAILADRRHPQFPDVPTVAEFGYAVSTPGFGGLYAPAGVPAPVLAVLEKGCATAAADGSYKAVAAHTGALARYLDHDGFVRRLQDDSRAKAALIQSLHLKLD
jgi:tripartite-type tricarboxylate transporter receptor subunit TctC